MNIKKLAKKIDKWYWEHGQRLTVDTYEDRNWNPKNLCSVDVCLYDPVKKESEMFLFSISNYRSFEELERDNGDNIYSDYDITTVASLPYYMNRHFFIRKNEALTDEDIEKCTRYFVHNVLNLKYRVWNFKVNEQEKEELKIPEVFEDYLEALEAERAIKEIEQSRVDFELRKTAKKGSKTS